MEYVKPRRLSEGDTVAVVSTSWGGPHAFPHVFEAGLDILRDTFGLRIAECPTARMSSTDLRADPRRRAEDLNAAFADPAVAAIVVSIGREDSVRILEHLDTSVALANPKILLGFSDTTSQTAFLNTAGLVTFNGPSVMAGFAQLAAFPEAARHVRAMLFEPTEHLDFEPYPEWVDRYRDWRDPALATGTGPRRPTDGWHWLQGERRIVLLEPAVA